MLSSERSPKRLSKRRRIGVVVERAGGSMSGVMVKGGGVVVSGHLAKLSLYSQAPGLKSRGRIGDDLLGFLRTGPPTEKQDQETKTV